MTGKPGERASCYPALSAEVEEAEGWGSTGYKKLSRFHPISLFFEVSPPNLPKKSKPKGIIEQLVDSYNKLDKDDKAIVGAIGLIVFFVIFAAVLSHPVQFLLGVSIAAILGFLGYLKIKTDLAPEHILAFGAVAVALTLAGAISLGALDPYVGGGIITSLVGGGALAEVIKARKEKPK